MDLSLEVRTLGIFELVEVLLDGVDELELALNKFLLLVDGGSGAHLIPLIEALIVLSNSWHFFRCFWLTWSPVFEY